MGSALPYDFFNELFGPDTPAAIVFSDRQTLTLLRQARGAGLSISNTTPPNEVSKSTHAMEIAIRWLQKNGRVPVDLHEFSNLPEVVHAALGLEPATVASDPEMSVQQLGVPHFKELDMAKFLAGLRFAARYQELRTQSKPVFQVGVLTQSIDATGHQFFAQTIAADLGEVTDTVWLYRCCAIGVDRQYEEHWQPFDGTVIQGPNALAAQPQVSQSQALQPPLDNFNDSGIGSGSSGAPTPASQEPKPRRQSRIKSYQYFNHSALTDAELFATSPANLQGPVILRLAKRYSNQEIFTAINDARGPGRGVKSVNVITKRITKAIKDDAAASGRTEKEIREEIADAKTANGVTHKMKVDTKPYV